MPAPLIAVLVIIFAVLACLVSNNFHDPRHSILITRGPADPSSSPPIVRLSKNFTLFNILE